MHVQLFDEFLDTFTVTSVSARCIVTTIGSTSEVQPDGTAVVPADASPCVEGTYQLECRVSYVDPFGVSHEWHCLGVTVTFAPPLPATFEIGLVENYSEPEEYRFHWDERAGRLAFCLSRPGTVDAVVRNSSGLLVRTLASDQAFPASPCDSNPPVTQLEWDFTDESETVVPDGDYTVEMSATDTLRTA